jgi:hypothetical protein
MAIYSYTTCLLVLFRILSHVMLIDFMLRVTNVYCTIRHCVLHYTTLCTALCDTISKCQPYTVKHLSILHYTTLCTALYDTTYKCQHYTVQRLSVLHYTTKLTSYVPTYTCTALYSAMSTCALRFV